VLEMIVPGIFFLWVGMASVVVGCLMLVFPDVSWEIQILVFGVLSIVMALAGRKYIRLFPIHTQEPGLNRRGSQYVGRVYTLDHPIENGRGKIIVDDTTWKISCQTDLIAGQKIRVTNVDGTILVVVPEL
jgi:hypothetical protein